MGKNSGKKTRVEKWDDEEIDDSSVASHSRRSMNHDDLTYSMSRSRSFNVAVGPQHDEEELTDSQRSSRSNFLEDNGLVARGSPTLSRGSFGQPETEEAYRDSLSARSSQRRRTFDIIQFSDSESDDEKYAEVDGLLVEEIEPFGKHASGRSFCFRVTILFAIAGILGLATTLGVIEFQNRTTGSLRGDGAKSTDSSSVDSLFGNKSSMTNTHGLDVNSGSNSGSMINTHGLDVHAGEHYADCQDNMAFRHDNHAGQNCKWVAEANTAQRCANERILNNCRATCDPSCGGNSWTDEDEEVTEYPTEEPTVFPTLIPTDTVTSWETLDMTNVLDEDSNRNLISIPRHVS